MTQLLLRVYVPWLWAWRLCITAAFPRWLRARVSLPGCLARSFPYTLYPRALVLAFTLHMALLARGSALVPATYAPILLVAALVALLEYVYPNKLQWAPDRREIRTDLVYMLVVQLVLPKLLAFLIAISLLSYLATTGVTPSPYWPHGLPAAAQAVLMILLADFIRYWLHLASHRIRFLWRLHAVHHSPRKLYWLNVGRFHPLEKVLQFLLETSPFIVLGVGEYVVALYFLFYAINGFFQHCNIKLKFGALNYVISTAELHRWHHSHNVLRSKCNYGNNLIVWDLLFRTWYLPKGRVVGMLGLADPDYPAGFINQLRAPFVGRADFSDRRGSGVKQTLVNFLISVKMLIIKLTVWLPLQRAAGNPGKRQRRLLRKFVTANKNTEFGRHHNFSEIHSYADYLCHVPVQSYESLRPYIDQQECTGRPYLTREQPVMYVRTSGTTALPKLIPVLSSTIQDSRKRQQLLAYVQYRHCPQAFQGRLLGITSPAVESETARGAPVGSASGLIYRSMPRLLQEKYVVPHEVFEIEDPALKYLLILRLALAHRNITYIGAANPSTLLLLDSLLNAQHHTLIDDLDKGIFSQSEKLAPQLLARIGPRLRPDLHRAEALRMLFRTKKEIALGDVWPDIRLVATWTQGSCGIALDALRVKLPSAAQIVDPGYLSSEFGGSITINPDSNGGLPTFTENFFEFVEKSKHDGGIHDFIMLEQLEVGKEYQVFVTTGAGLYRYFMNDIIRVSGVFRSTPTIQFVQKGKGVTDRKSVV